MFAPRQGHESAHVEEISHFLHTEYPLVAEKLDSAHNHLFIRLSLTISSLTFFLDLQLLNGTGLVMETPERRQNRLFARKVTKEFEKPQGARK
jgi:hypothetical protein